MVRKTPHVNSWNTQKITVLQSGPRSSQRDWLQGWPGLQILVNARWKQWCRGTVTNIFWRLRSWEIWTYSKWFVPLKSVALPTGGRLRVLELVLATDHSSPLLWSQFHATSSHSRQIEKSNFLFSYVRHDATSLLFCVLGVEVRICCVLKGTKEPSM